MCRWVPELKLLPTPFIYSPWDAPTDVLQTAGVSLGCKYPHRVSTTGLERLRTRNVRALRSARKQWIQKVPEDADSDGYDVIRVPKDAACGMKGEKVRVFTVPMLRCADERLVGHWGDHQTLSGQYSVATDNSERPGTSTLTEDKETQVTATKR